jgi:hypothetical protein
LSLRGCLRQACAVCELACAVLATQRLAHKLARQAVRECGTKPSNRRGGLEVRLKTVTLKMWGNPSAQYITGYKSQEMELKFNENGKLCWDNLHKDEDMDYLAFYDEPEF